MSSNINRQDVEYLDDVLDIVLDRVMDEVEERIQGKADKHGVKMTVSLPEQAKIRGANLLLKMAKNYSPEAKLQKFVTSSNKILPHLRRVFNEAALMEKIPAEAKTDRFLSLCDKAGATAVADLVRKSMEVKPGP